MVIAYDYIVIIIFAYIVNVMLPVDIQYRKLSICPFAQSFLIVSFGRYAYSIFSTFSIFSGATISFIMRGKMPVSLKPHSVGGNLFPLHFFAPAGTLSNSEC